VNTRGIKVSYKALVSISLIIFVAGLLMGPALVSASPKLSLNEVDSVSVEENNTLISGGIGGPFLDAGQAEQKAGAIASFFTKEVQYWADDIDRWAEVYNLDPNLVATVMQIESCGHPEIGSPAGAQGLFQVMPFHFGADEDPLDPEINARRGLNYLYKGMELAGGRYYLALAGYNGGHGVIGQNLSTWDEETQRYVFWAMGILEDAQRGRENSPMLQLWLSAGGERLCRRAAEFLNLP
jgi:soluble lytic murein transglycosylase-like protein